MGDVIATYQVYARPGSLEKKAEDIALGLTIGSWTALPLLEQKQLLKHKGRVTALQEFYDDEHPNRFGEVRCEISIAYPTYNFTFDIPAILTTVFGKLSLDGEVKLLNLEFDKRDLSRFPGPKFGIKNIRSKLNTQDRPLLMSIFKGIIGRDIHFLREQLRDQAMGGVDIVKDDEILFDVNISFEDRIIAGKEILDEVYEKTGKRTHYAVNLSGRTMDLVDKAKHATELGADALLFNVHTYGLDMLQTLAENSEVQLPIMAHPAYSGAYTSSNFYGVAPDLLLGNLTRLAGADFSLFPSPYGSVAMEKEKTLAIARQLTEENGLNQAFPVPSAGIHPGLVPLLYHDFGNDCIINAGGGVHGHPEGAAAGVRAFRQAIDHVIQQNTHRATKAQELEAALAKWGGTS